MVLVVPLLQWIHQKPVLEAGWGVLELSRMAVLLMMVFFWKLSV